MYLFDEIWVCFFFAFLKKGSLYSLSHTLEGESVSTSEGFFGV